MRAAAARRLADTTEERAHDASKSEFRSCPSPWPTPRSSPGTRSPATRSSRDENLVDLETDKVVLEVPAPATAC